MKKLNKLLAGASVLVLASFNTQASCVPANCNTLGYTKSAADCDGSDMIKCPFDTDKVWCMGEAEPTTPEPGLIYYSDGTFSKKVLSGKTPVGIIAYVDGYQSFLISLDETSTKWKESGAETEICNAAWYNTSSMEKEMNGLLNTMCLVSDSSTNYPAAQHCVNLKPASSGEGSKGWYLPSLGQLKVAGENVDAVNEALEKLGKPLLSGVYSSSTAVMGNGIAPGTSIYTYNFDSSAIKTGNKVTSLSVRCAYNFADTRTPTTVKAQPGVIYNSDGTFTDDFYPDKTPVGVVAYVKTYAGRTTGYVVSLSEKKTAWGGDGGNISCLTDYTSSNPGTGDANGAANTSCILSSGGSYPAAEFCGNLKAASSGKGSSGWYLPAAGEIKNIVPYTSLINETLAKLSKTELQDDEYWTSTEYQNKYSTSPDAYVVNPDSGYTTQYSKSSNMRVPVRCFLAF